MELMIQGLIEEDYSTDEALKMTEKIFNGLPEHLKEKYKNGTDKIYSIKDKLWMEKIQTIKKETKEEDKKVMIRALMDNGYSIDEAHKTVQEAFKKLS